MHLNLQTATALLILTLLIVSPSALAGNLDEVFVFDIQAKSLDKALLQFGAQAHVQISFAWSPSTARPQKYELKGRYTGTQVLAQLLKGTQLRYIAEGHTLEILPQASPPPTSAARTRRSSNVQSRGSPRNSDDQNSSVAISRSTDPSTDNNLHKRTALHEVTITGTHIKEIAPAYPVTSITRTEILQSGLSTIGDVLRTSPLVYSGGENPGAIAVGTSSSGSSTGSGIGTANLFGIGSDATLTLINGQRASGTDFASPSSPDLSMIPVVAVQRIEIQTGASSAIYGSDAVAGVVNVILRSHYNGAETTGYVGWSQDGGGFARRYSQLVGQNLPQGSVLVAAEFDQTDALRADQRSISEAAGPEEYLDPKTKSESLLLSTDYDITTRLQAHAFSLYTHRTTLNIDSDEQQPSRIDEFASSAGLTYQISGDRSFGLDVTDSGFALIRAITTLPCPCGIPITEATQNGVIDVDLHGSGTAVVLPTGALYAAVGAGFRREQFDIEGNEGDSVISGRRVSDTYLEVNIPLVRHSALRTGLEDLRLDGALRYSHYSDLGDTTNPLVGVIYTPFSRLSVKATYGTSFRAPTEEELYTPRFVELLPGSRFLGALSESQVLLESGGSAQIGPQTAHSLTTTMQFSPTLRRLPGRVLSTATYFYIHYTDLIGQPINAPRQALVTPLVAPYVILNPTVEQQNAAIAPATTLTNPFALPYDAGKVSALLDDLYTNLSAADIHGVNGTLNYRWSSAIGNLTVTWAGTWLRFDRRLLAGSPPQAISGVLFNPPNFKMRGAAGWSFGAWDANVFVNHISDEEFLQGTAGPPVEIAGWTTMDGQLAYTVTWSGKTAASANIALSVTNLLGTKPPLAPSAAFTLAPVNFDTANASAIGRSFALSVAVHW